MKGDIMLSYVRYNLNKDGKHQCWECKHYIMNNTPMACCADFGDCKNHRTSAGYYISKKRIACKDFEINNKILTE